MGRFKSFVIIVVDLDTSLATVHGTFKDYGTADGIAYKFRQQAEKIGRNFSVTVKGVRRPVFKAIWE